MNTTEKIILIVEKCLFGNNNKCTCAKDIEVELEKVKKEAIQNERERILSTAKEIVLIEMQVYGTDKHGLSLSQLKQMLKNR